MIKKVTKKVCYECFEMFLKYVLQCFLKCIQNIFSAYYNLNILNFKKFY